MSTSVVPPQPTTAIYGPQDLELFPRIPDRAAYIADFGHDAPTEDPSWPEQNWQDPSATSKADSDGNVSYLVFNPDGSTKTITIPATRAASVNLPGIEQYPPYVIAPTDAYIQTPVSQSQINPEYLSLLSDAQALAESWGLAASSVQDFSITGAGMTTVYPADEPRRMWGVMWQGTTQILMGQMIDQMNTNGVGAPGSWNLSGPAPVWVTAVPSTVPALTGQVPFPIRPLLPDEKIVPTLGGGFYIVNTNLINPGVDGVLTPAQNAALTLIAATVSQMSTTLAAMAKSMGVTAS